MENASKSNNIKENQPFAAFSINEVTNALGENYRTIAKILNILATEGKIEVTEKLVNNRAVKAYYLSISDLQEIKSKFLKNKHLYIEKNPAKVQMLLNATTTDNSSKSDENVENDTSIKIFEVMRENADLSRELGKLKQDIQAKINENVRLDADLAVAKSELKFITDKSKTMEAAFCEQKQRAETLENKVKTRNFQLIFTGACLLVVLVVIICYFAFGR